LFSDLLARLTSLCLCGLMTKITFFDEEDRKLLFETNQKLDEATKLMGELIETIEVLSDPEMIKDIQQGLADIKAGKVKELRALLTEEAR
jgi:hypothetical protein